MRRASWILGMLAAASAALFACSTDITPGTLGFTVAEGLLVLYPEDSTAGYALLSSGTGTCASLQAGNTVVPAADVAGLSYLYMPLGNFDANSNLLTLSAGTYNVADPNGTFSVPSLVAYAAAIQTDDACDPVEQDATSGTVTVSPFDTADGGSSSLTFSAVFGTTQVSGSYPLTTCLVTLDAGIGNDTCVQCIFPGDGGPCAIQ
jgi:hypothetical protein